ncbi:MAG: hypothetical protein IT204_12290 [Fimbriimonadaceae bacterium]|nr:hypothetical protein [Fimbriimonadaceae bacterium]
MRRRVFVDSWAWIGMACSTDPVHPLVVRLTSTCVSEGATLLTTDAVLSEALTRLRYDGGWLVAWQLADVAQRMAGHGQLAVEYGNPDRWQRALEWFGRFTDQRFSFVDCLSFAVMAELGIQECLTSDPHFATAGFTPLGRR